MISKNIEKVIKIATISVVIYLLCFGVAMTFFPIRPFWNDEWRLVYNLKFKNVPQLWGTLDLLQECPRVYLTILKEVTSYFDYGYTALRAPALVIGCINVLFLFHLRKKIFQNQSVYSYLFILIFISSQTFTDYLIQVKHYEVDIFMCLLALWQLMTLLEINGKGSPLNKYKYLLLCFSFLAAPFFSYIYPLAIAPVFVMIILYTVFSSKNKQSKKSNAPFYLYLPLVIASISIVIFYLIDVKQLMADKRMYISYVRMLGHKTNESYFIENFWNLFALVGSGLVYEIIFGVLGIASFVYGIYRLTKVKTADYAKQNHFRLYAVILLILTLCLFLSGILMGSVARLVVFTVPSISFLIVSFIEDLKNKYRFSKVSNALTIVLFLGLYGNIITTCINRFTYPEYSNQIKTYWHTSMALKEARHNKIPILYTDGVRGDIIHTDTLVPGKIDANTITPDQIAGVDTLCAEVILKVNPEYKVWDTVPVYMIPDMKWTKEYVNQLPSKYQSAIVCDGINFFKQSR